MNKWGLKLRLSLPDARSAAEAQKYISAMKEDTEIEKGISRRAKISFASEEILASPMEQRKTQFLRGTGGLTMAETYYSLTDIVKHCDNLVAAMPTSFFNGIWKVRNTLYRIPAADVVTRDCYDRLLIENDELRKERPVVRCKDCQKGIPDSEHATAYSCYGIWHKPDWFCAGGVRKDGDA